MKQKELELLLQRVPTIAEPTPELEQYMTPAGIAADILFTAYQFEDIYKKTVLDLGCGTGIFTVGASLLGAEKVIGVDVDTKSVEIARVYADQNALDIEYQVQNVEDVTVKCDTVLMNPPFGAQKSNQQADRRFLEKGFAVGKIIYSLHLKKTIGFIEKLVTALEGDIFFQKDYRFPIKWMFEFHSKKRVYYDITLLRICTNL